MPQSPVYLDNHATTRGRSARGRGDAAVFHRRLRQPGQHQPCFRLGSKDAVDAARGADRRGDRRGRHARSSSPAAPPRATIWPCAAWPSGTRRNGKHLVTVATEHKAVLDPLARLGRRGFEVTLLPVEPAGSAGRAGSIRERWPAAIRDDTILVSVMLANNEIGVVQPLAEIGRICRQRGVRCTATPRRRWARCRSTSRRWASIC